MEAALLEAHCAKIAGAASDARVLIEFGSGSSRKTSLLLGALTQVPTYVPIDIAAESLQEAATWLSERHDGLTIVPLIADFTRTRTLPQVARKRKRLGFFSGSTIGNLNHDEAPKLPRQRGSAARQGERLPDRRRSQEADLDPDPRLQ